MAPDSRRCPKCDGPMQVGFVPDTTYGGTVVAGWHEGAPRKSFRQGTVIDRETVIAIDAWRCTRCGFIEL